MQLNEDNFNLQAVLVTSSTEVKLELNKETQKLESQLKFKVCYYCYC